MAGHVLLEHGRVAVEKEQHVLGPVVSDSITARPVDIVVFVVEWIATLEVELFFARPVTNMTMTGKGRDGKVNEEMLSYCGSGERKTTR